MLHTRLCELPWDVIVLKLIQFVQQQEAHILPAQWVDMHVYCVCPLCASLSLLH